MIELGFLISFGLIIWMIVMLLSPETNKSEGKRL